MNRNVMLVFVLSALCFCLFACKGDKGVNGPAGANGLPGYTIDFQNGVYPPGSGYTGTADAFIYMNSPAINAGGATLTTVGKYSSNAASIYRVLMRFDISGYFIPQNVTVTKAFLTLAGAVFYQGAGATATIYALTSPFVEMEATWNVSSTGISWGTAGGGGDFGPNPAAISSKWLDPDNKTTIELSPSLVQGWITNPSANYGIVLMSIDETNVINSSDIYLSNYSVPSYRPRITIYYTLN
jgi:hypothetical protein